MIRWVAQHVQCVKQGSRSHQTHPLQQCPHEIFSALLNACIEHGQQLRDQYSKATQGGRSCYLRRGSMHQHETWNRKRTAVLLDFQKLFVVLEEPICSAERLKRTIELILWWCLGTRHWTIQWGWRCTFRDCSWIVVGGSRKVVSRWWFRFWLSHTLLFIVAVSFVIVFPFHGVLSEFTVMFLSLLVDHDIAAEFCLFTGQAVRL